MKNDINSSLIESGFVRSSNGEVLLSHQANELYNSVIKYIINEMSPYSNNIINAPPIISESLIEKLEYDRNFPQNIIIIGVIDNDNQKKYASPSACFHCYSSLENKEIEFGNNNCIVVCRCMRNESGSYLFPFKLRSFTMVELVLFGNEEYINKINNEMKIKFENIFKRWNLDGSFINSTDAFFLDQSKGSKIIQKLKELKKEFSIEIDSNNVPLMSINNHERYFTNKFNIRYNHNLAHSSCIAFGIERIVAAVIIKFGSLKENWPEELQ